MSIVTLPTTPSPSGVTPTLVDKGMTITPATGAPATRFNRPGNCFRLEVAYPPMKAATAAPFITRLIRAKRDGLRMKYPLLGVTQGSPGTPLVNGSGAAGTSLPIKGLTVGYVIQEGYWLSVIDSAGVYYLHTVATGATADGSGNATIIIEPPLRAPLVNGNTILLAVPMVEGLIVSDPSWALTPDKLIALSFTLEEAG